MLDSKLLHQCIFEAFQALWYDSQKRATFHGELVTVVFKTIFEQSLEDGIARYKAVIKEQECNS